MPKTVSITSAFTTGEISPSAYGRTDIQKYQNGMACVRNYLPDPLGGLKRRMGTRFVCETKYSQFDSRLIPFEPNTVAAYMLEVGCEYLRFYKNSAQLSGNPELVNNGTFDSNINGWTDASTGGGTVTWVAGAMRLTGLGAGNAAIAYQDVTVVAGAAYIVTFRLVSGVSTSVRIGSTSQGSDLVLDVLGVGSYTYTVTSPTTTLSIQFSETGNGTDDVDDVSIKLAGALEVTTPYDYGEVHAIDVVQSADEQFWLHGCHPTRKLQRYGDTCWRFNCVTWSPPPSIEYGSRVESSISASALSGTITITAFNNSPAFLAADVDREIQVLSGINAGARGGIKSVTSAMVAVVNVCVPWSDTSLQCAGTWKLSGSPLTVITPDDVDPIGKNATLCTQALAWRRGNPGESDVGKFAIINGGAYELTCVANANTALAVIRSVQTGVASQPSRKGEKGAWTLEEPLWNCSRGWASTGDFQNDRLWLDSTFRFVGSKSGDFENFAIGPNDDDGINFALNSKTITTIRGIVGGKDLLLFTAGGEFSVTSEGAVITPTDVLVSAETTHGSSGIVPVRVGSRTTLFVDRSRKSLLEFTVPKDSIAENYEAPDLLLLAEHLTASTQIHEFVYQRKPQPTLWVVLDSGELITCTYRREENVVAWAKHNTCGLFESVGVMPHPDGDRQQVWAIVNRTINGGTKRYVEYFDDSTLGPYDRRYTDSSVTFSCTSTNRLTGLGHLECAYVQVLGNGAFLCNTYVVNGEVNLGGTTTGPFEVGLPYVSEGITLPPEVSFGGGSIQPLPKRWARVFLRTRDSCSMVVRTGTGALENLPAGKALGEGIKDHDVPRLGDFVDGRITFRQENPLPSHVLMVGGVIEVGVDV